MSEVARKEAPIGVIIKIAIIWVLSDIGFNFLMSFIGSDGSYSNNPITISLYYFFWICLTLVVFWRLYRGWEVVEVNISMFDKLVLMGTLVACYIVFVFPLFPPTILVPFLNPPTELLSATSWYFVPKSFDIVFQQLLIVAMLIGLKENKYTFKEIAIWSAVFFGGSHIFLIFEHSFYYTLIFTASATVAGLIFPFLLLRIRNGFLYAYSLHWTFYAVIIAIARLY